MTKRSAVEDQDMQGVARALRRAARAARRTARVTGTFLVTAKAGNVTYERVSNIWDKP